MSDSSMGGNLTKMFADSWEQMPSSKRLLIVVGLVVILILGVYTVFNSVNQKLNKTISETENYRKSLNYIAENQYLYKLNHAKKEAMRQKLIAADPKVVSKLTSIASGLGFDVSVSPSDPHKTNDDSGTEEQEIVVSLKNVEYGKVMQYLIEISRLDTPIYMRQLNLTRNSALTSSDTKMNVTVTLLSYRLKEQNAT